MADAGQESSEGISVSKPVARVMMLVNAAVWGSGYTMLKHVQENMPTQWMMFFRMASAVLLMAIVFFPRLRRIRLRRYIVPGLILALTFWLGFIFQLKGLETTSPGRNSFFTDTYCVMVPFVVWAFTRKRPSWQHLVAAFVCAFGIGLVSLSGGGGAELMHMSFGDAMTIIGAFFFALNLVLVGFIGKDFDAIALMLAEFVWCALLFGAGAVLTEGGPSMAWARWDIVLCIAYLVIGSTVIAQVFQTIAIQNLPTSEASVILSTECIFAMLVSVIFTGETLTVPSLCGFALIFGAILLSEIQLPSAKRKVSFPWFMLGFIGASIIGTFVPFIGAIAPNLVDFAYIVLGMAMAALGINVNFSAIAKKGQKAFLASFLTSVLLMCFAAGIAALFF